MVSNKSKLNLYWSIIRPIVTIVTIKKKGEWYWKGKNKKNIFGPNKDRDGAWRIKTNDELDKLIRHKDITNHIKAQKLRWFGHLQRMAEERMVKRSI
jgi:hypothetical protein